MLSKPHVLTFSAYVFDENILLQEENIWTHPIFPHLPPLPIFRGVVPLASSFFSGEIKYAFPCSEALCLCPDHVALCIDTRLAGLIISLYIFSSAHYFSCSRFLVVGLLLSLP